MEKWKNRIVIGLMAVVLGVTTVAMSTSISNALTLPMSKKEIAKTQAIMKQAEPFTNASKADLKLLRKKEKEKENITISAKNFPDRKFRAWLKKQSYGKDGVLTPKEIAKVTSIKVPKKGISTLKGIENFKELDTLQCKGNDLEELDVSKNDKLKNLNCSKNKIEKLNVTKNPALDQLDCSSNRLTGLDLKNQKKDLDLSLDDQENIIGLGDGKDSYGIEDLGSLEKDKITDLEGASSGDMSLKGLQQGDDVLYDYDCGNGQKMPVKLKVAKENKLTGDLVMEDITIGETPKKPNVKAKKGKVRYLYSDSPKGPFTEELPETAGKMYMKASVGATGAYAGVQSAPVAFNVRGNLPEPNSNLETTHGALLGTVNLGGVWQWTDDPETKADANISKYKAYLPLDQSGLTDLEYKQHNEYNPLTQRIERYLEVTVKPADNDWKTALNIDHWEGGWTYGEEAKAIKVPENVEAEFGIPVFMYSKEQGTGFTETIPSNAGTWWVKAIIKETKEYEGLDGVAIDFEIKKATPVAGKDFEIPVGLDIAKEGDKLSSVTLPDPFEWKKDTAPGGVNTEDKEWTIGDDHAYDAIFTPDDQVNYNTADVKITIKLLNKWITEDDETFPYIRSWTYGEPAKPPKGKNKGDIGQTDADKADITYWYSNEKGGNYSTIPPSKAGAWYLKATVKETNDYYKLETEEPYKFTIYRAEPEQIKEPENLEASVGDTLSKISPGLDWTWVEPSTVVTASKGEYPAYFKVDDANYNYDTPLVPGYLPGSQKVKRDLKVTFKQGQNEWINKDNPVSIEDWTYGQTAKTPKAQSKYGEPVFTYSSSKEGPFVEEVPQKAGVWWLKGEVRAVDEPTGYTGTEPKVVSFTIAKALAPPVDQPKNLTSTAGSKLSSVKLPEGWQWVSPDAAVDKTNGSYDATFKVDGENYDYSKVDGYNSKNQVVTRALTITLPKEKNEWTKPLAMEGWTYGEASKLPVGAAKYGTPAFTYSKSANGPFTATIPAQAGTWYLKGEVAETDTYTGLSETKTFIIKKAVPVQSPPIAITATYGQLLSKVDLPAGYTWTDGTKAVGDVGQQTHKAKFTPSDTTNYETVDNIDIVIGVTKAKNSWRSGFSIDDWIFGEPSEPTSEAEFGSPTYTYSDEKEGTYTSKVPTKAGTWYAKAVIKGTSNYEGIEDGPAKFTIKPKDADDLNVPQIDQSTNLDQMQITDGDKTLVKGKDYTVTEKKSGSKVTVTLTFKGNYKGTVKQTYTIQKETQAGDNNNSGTGGNNGADGNNGANGAAGDNGTAGGNGQTSAENGGNAGGNATGNAAGNDTANGNGNTDGNADGNTDANGNANTDANGNKANDVAKAIKDAAVKTWDAFDPKVWIGILIVSAAVAIMAFRRRRR